MANDTSIRLRYPTGKTLYTQIESGSGVWNGTSYATFATADWATYATATPETPASSGRYVCQFPTGSAAGNYSWTVYLRSGASPATTDTVIASGSGYWDGTTFGGAASLGDAGASLTSLGDARVATIDAGVATANASLSSYNDLLVTGKVNDVSPQAGSFIISLTDANGNVLSGALPSTDDYARSGLQLCWTSGLNKTAKLAITGYTLLNTTTARVTFANGFANTPSNGDTFNIL